MGWASGSRLATQLIAAIKEHVEDDDVRKDVYIDMINALEDFDCDTLDECMGEDPQFDEALYEVHPHWRDEEEDEDEDGEL